MMSTIKASPTKEFFISMLTRDVSLSRAILDLVDNSVDAANTNGNIADGKISLNISADSFVISDNCGGINKFAAQEYAFRFGRDADRPETPSSVGQFGVGMKRTLFKIGRKFEVLSRHQAGCFSVSVNVDDWLRDTSSEWTFDMKETSANRLTSDGTEITITDLFESVSDQFSLDVFLNDLADEISKAHFKSIFKGLKININGRAIDRYKIVVKQSEELSPYHKVIDIDGVDVKITAGVGERNLHDGGWYVVCNGRLIESSEQTIKTGWASPKYHPDYSFFRGVVDFSCEDSSKLPWTTTKTGVDVDNTVFRKARQEMNVARAEVISYLRERRDEQNHFNNKRVDDTPISNVFDDAMFVDIYDVRAESNFKRPVSNQVVRDNFHTSITYKMPKDKVERAKDILEVGSNAQVGVETFNYFFEYECGDE